MRFIEQIPILIVSDMVGAIEFYSGKLGFEVAFRAGDPATYCGLSRDAIQVHLISAGSANQPAGGGRISITIDDVDLMHAYCRSNQVKISVPIDDRAYGRRDFNAQDPDGNVVVFGSES